MASPASKYLAESDAGHAIASAAKRAQVTPERDDVGFSVADSDVTHPNPVAQSFTSASGIGIHTVGSTSSVMSGAEMKAGAASGGSVLSMALPDVAPRNKLVPLSGARGSHRSVTRIAPLGASNGLTPPAKLPRKAFETGAAHGSDSTEPAREASAGTADPAATSGNDGQAPTTRATPQRQAPVLSRQKPRQSHATNAHDSSGASQHESVYRKAMSRLHQRSSRSRASQGSINGETVSFKGATPDSSYRAVTETVVRRIGSEFQKTFPETILEREKLKYRLRDQRFVNCILLPDSVIRRRWDLFLQALVLYTAIILPLDVGFELSSASILQALGTIVDICFVIDIIMNFRTAVLADEGALVTDLTTIATMYARGWLACDLLASVPFDTVWWLVLDRAQVNPRIRYIRLLKCLRLLKVFRVLKSVEHNRFASLWRLSRLMVFYVMCIHWFGCTFHFIGLVEFQRDPSTVWLVEWAIQDGTIMDRYVAATHASMAMLVGNSLNPFNFIERGFGTFTNFFGACINAVLFGQVAELLTNRDSVFNRYRQEMEAVNRNMRVLQLPNEVQERVRNFAAFQFQRQRMLDHQSFLRRLSEPLATEVCIFLHRDTVTKVPLFQGCNAEFIAALVQALQHRLYMPGDFIIHYGQFGSDMYFINSGECDVIGPDGSMVLATLGPQEFFGELALLTRMRRTATIQARTYCDLSVLSRYQLDRLLDKNPEVEANMREVARERVEEFMKATKAAEFARMVGRRAAKRAMRQASYRRGLLAADIGVKKDHTDELAQGAAAAPALAKVKASERRRLARRASAALFGTSIAGGNAHSVVQTYGERLGNPSQGLQHIKETSAGPVASSGDAFSAAASDDSSHKLRKLRSGSSFDSQDGEDGAELDVTPEFAGRLGLGLAKRPFNGTATRHPPDAAAQDDQTPASGSMVSVADSAVIGAQMAALNSTLATLVGTVVSLSERVERMEASLHHHFTSRLAPGSDPNAMGS